MKFSRSFYVAPDDVDEQGHVNNVAYVRWVQEVAVAHWFSVTDEAIREAFTWVVLRHEIDYKKQCYAGDRIDISTWVGDATRVTWERLTEIRCGNDPAVAARSIWCLVNRSSMRPARIGDDLKRRLTEAFPRDKGTES